MLRFHKKWLLVLFLFPLLWRSFFYASDFSITSGLDFNSKKSELLYLLLPLLSTDVFLALALAFNLKTLKKKTTLNYFLLGFFGILLFLLSPTAWETAAELAGFPILFLLGVLPVASYTIASQLSQRVAALIFGLLTTPILLFFANTVRDQLSTSSILLEAGVFRGPIELLCLFLIFIFIILRERKQKKLILVLNLGLFFIAFYSILTIFLFKKEKASLADYLTGLDAVVLQSINNKVQCEQFDKVLRPLVLKNSEFNTLEKFSQAMQVLKSYPSQLDVLQLSQPYQEAIPTQLKTPVAQLVVLKGLFSITPCQEVEGLVLQKNLLASLSRRASLFSSEFFNESQEEIWKNLVLQSKTVSSSLLMRLAAENLRTILTRNNTQPEARAEVLSFLMKLELHKKKIDTIGYLYSFRMPSERRIALLLESTQNELKFLKECKQELSKLMTKNPFIKLKN